MKKMFMMASVVLFFAATATAQTGAPAPKKAEVKKEEVKKAEPAKVEPAKKAAPKAKAVPKPNGGKTVGK